MSESIDLSDFSKKLRNAKQSKILPVELKLPPKNMLEDEEVCDDRFLASCERGILVPIIIDGDLHLIDGMRRCIGAFCGQLRSIDCIILPTLTPLERFAFRILINAHRKPTISALRSIKDHASFERPMNPAYRSDFLKFVSENMAIRDSITRSLILKSKKQISLKPKRTQVKIAETAAEAVHLLDLLISEYSEPPEELVSVRQKFSDGIRSITSLRIL